MISSSGFEYRGNPRYPAIPTSLTPGYSDLAPSSSSSPDCTPSNVSYSHSTCGAADAPYFPTVHSPHTGPALDRPLPSLPTPATSLLTRCNKPPGRRAGPLAEPWARKICCSVNSTSKAALKKLRDDLNFPRLVGVCFPLWRVVCRENLGLHLSAVHSRHAQSLLSAQSSTFVCQQ